MATAFAPKFADLVRNYTSTTGTADFQLGDPVSGYTGFASALQTGDRFYYSAIGVTNPSEDEVGRGTLLANGLSAREPVAGPKTDFSAGAKTIALVVAAEWYGSARGVDSRAALASQPAGGTAMLLERGCEGPFAWDGFVSFWVKNAALVVWILVMAWALRAALDHDGDMVEAEG